MLKIIKRFYRKSCRRSGNVKIEYKIIFEKGPDHDKYFVAEVMCNGKVLANGSGKSKKNAEMQAAKVALEKMQ